MGMLVALLLAGCGDLVEQLNPTEQVRPFDSEPISKKEVTKLKKLFPRDWEKPKHGRHPASTQMRLLNRITGKKRTIKQQVLFPDAPKTKAERASTSFLDPSGRYIIGKDWNHDPERKESTRFILYYDETTKLFRGLSWTQNVLGEDDPVQMAGRFVSGKTVIEWKSFQESVGVDTKSHLVLTSAENFIWRVERIREGKIVTWMTSESNLDESWP